MPSLPQSNNLQEIQRAFLERDAELRRLVGDTKTATAASVTGLRKTITSGRGTSGSTTPTGGTTATTVKGRRVITAVSTEAMSFYETNYTQAEFTESADIISIETNYPAWVRVYSSAAARLDDASRLFSEAPVAGTGLMVEVLTYEPDDLLIYLSPVPFWNNCDTVLGKTAYIAVTRWDSGDPEFLEMTFTILPQEEMDKNGSQGLQGPRGFTGAGYRTLGEWSGTETYLENDVVGRNGSVYSSLLNDNLNQDPETATTYWILWAAKGAKGDKGDDGDAGSAATVTVGTVTSGETASVTDSGTSTAAVLDFVLQKGDAGAAGEDGLTINWQGAYNAATTYAKNDGVSYNGSSFISKVDSNTGNTPDPTQETAYWGILAKAGADGSSGNVILQSKIATGDGVSVKNGGTTSPTTVDLTTRVASLTITPTKRGNKIRVRGCYVGEKSSTGNTCMALFVGSTHIRQTVTSAQGGYAHSGSTIGEYVTTSLDTLTVDLRCNGNNETATIHWATLEVEEINV